MCILNQGIFICTLSHDHSCVSHDPNSMYIFTTCCYIYRLYTFMTLLLRKEYHVCLKSQAREYLFTCILSVCHMHLCTLQADTQAGTMSTALEEWYHFNNWLGILCKGIYLYKCVSYTWVQNKLKRGPSHDRDKCCLDIVLKFYPYKCQNVFSLEDVHCQVLPAYIESVYIWMLYFVYCVLAGIS